MNSPASTTNADVPTTTVGSAGLDFNDADPHCSENDEPPQNTDSRDTADTADSGVEL